MTVEKLCTLADVQRYVDTVGHWTATVVGTEIENVTEEIYEECGDPVLTVKSPLGYDSQDTSFYREYTLGDQRIYMVDRVFVGTTTKRELSSAVDFAIAKKVGMIRLTAGGSAGGSTLDQADDITIQYIPGVYSRYCAIRTAESLLNPTDIMNSGKSSKELSRILQIRNKIETTINQRLGVQFSSQYKYHNDTYGVVKRIQQNHDRNKYLWKAD